jgi:hypothetical protein
MIPGRDNPNRNSKPARKRRKKRRFDRSAVAVIGHAFHVILTWRIFSSGQIPTGSIRPDRAVAGAGMNAGLFETSSEASSKEKCHGSESSGCQQARPGATAAAERKIPGARRRAESGDAKRQAGAQPGKTKSRPGELTS